MGVVYPLMASTHKATGTGLHPLLKGRRSASAYPILMAVPTAASTVNS